MMILQHVSVIVPTYKSLDYLRRTIVSLEKQSFDRSHFEVVVVDDGSKDETEEWLLAYTGSLNLKVEILNKNQGRSHARNVGVDLSNNPILVFLDGDMELESEFIENHAKWHLNPDIVAIGRVVYDPKLGQRGYARYLQGRGAMKFRTADQIPGRYLLSGNCSMTRDTFNKVKGFDESIIHYGEDLDMGIRLEKLDMKLIYDSSLVVSHLHIRPLNDVLKTSFEYGFKSLPQLAKLHPELFSQLRLDWLGSGGFSTLLKKFVLSDVVYFPLYRFVKLLNDVAIPPILYSYLIFRNYYKGYEKYVGSSN
mgnify:CR=1 FL=1